MSARALKRLERQKLEQEQSLKLSNDAIESDDPDDNHSSIKQQSKFNAFDLLEDSDQQESDDYVSEDEPPQKIEQKQNPEPIKSTKKSKKKKNQKAKLKTPEVDSDEELDKILRDLKLKDERESTPTGDEPLELFDFEQEYDLTEKPIPLYDSNFKYFTSKQLKQSLPLLSIESISNLDQDNEYKNLFGNSLSLDTIEDANSTTSLAISPELLQQFKKLAKLTRGWGGKDRRNVPGTTKKLLLSRIRDDWLPTQIKPMGMEEIKNDDEILEFYLYKEEDLEEEQLKIKVQHEKKLGVKYFKFNKLNNMTDRAANTRFYASVVMTPDPESLMQLLQQHPYHTETLLQDAMVLLRQGDNKATSNALIEKAIFTFDRSLHKTFHELLQNSQNGLLRLPYERFMNRQFYLCLFRYIIALGERSTFFTALSYCKLLLSLSPAEDPLGVRYFIDFYCIMSEEYQYLIRMSQSPLVSTYEKWFTPGIAFSTVLAYLKLNKVDKAEQALHQAFEAHPYTAFKLYQLLNLSTDGLNVKEKDFKITAEIQISAESYLIRANILWKDSSDRQFLKEQIFKLFNNFKPEEGGYRNSIFKFLGFASTNEDEPDNEIPLNLIRFTILSGEPKLMGKLPQKVWSSNDTFEYDVLPPKDDHSGESSGIFQTSNITDSMINYVDQNLLGTIIQNRTADSGFEEILRQLELEHADNEEET